MHPLVKYGAPLLNLVPPSFIKIFCDLVSKKFDPYGINDSLIRKILGQLYHFYPKPANDAEICSIPKEKFVRIF